MKGPMWAWWRAPAALAGWLLLLAASGLAGQEVPKVRALLFFSPTCPHCHQVMTVDLPPLMGEYGDRLQIAAVSTATPAGEEMYLAVVEHFGVPVHRRGVPALVVGNTVLVGSGEIPAQFPGIVRQGLAAGGIDWPAIPAVLAELEAQGLIEHPRPAAVRPESAAVAAPPAAAPTVQVPAGDPARPAAQAPRDTVGRVAAAPAQTVSPETAAAREAVPSSERGGAAAAEREPSNPNQAVMVLDGQGPPRLGMLDRFRLDPAGNGLAVVVLFGMLLVLAAVGAALAGRLSWRPGPEWLTPLLSLVGLGVAIYLAYVEVTGATAVCGPVGDCNTVQQSSYARIGGLVPVGLLGVFGYMLLLNSWALAVAGPVRYRAAGRLALWAGALAGTFFSVYLTFLEPFVIGATCAWCVTSAVIMALLLFTATPRLLAAVRRSASRTAG